MKLLLDTNIYVGFKSGHAEIVDYLTMADLILISPIVSGELMFGFRNVYPIFSMVLITVRLRCSMRLNV
jgi:hypothetical protein